MTDAELAAAIDARTARCAVIGLGFIGTTLMDALAASGFEAHGVDRVPAAVERFRAHAAARPFTPARPGSAGTSPDVVDGAPIVIVAVRTPVAADGAVDLEPLASAAAILRRHRCPRRLVILESTVPPGTTRRFATELLGHVPGDGTWVAHAPERLSVGHDWRDFRAIPHLVGGLDAGATAVAARFLGRVVDRVVPVASPEVSELSKLLENAFITVGVGLAGEITRIANALGIAASDVCDAAATKTTRYLAFHPGPGVGGHCLPNDLRMLAATSRELGWPAPLLAGAAAVTAAQPGWVVDRLEQLARAGGGLAGREVLVVGVGFKIGTADTTEAPAREVVRVLRARGARPVFVDALVHELVVDGEPVPRIDAAALAPGRFAAGVVLSGDPTVGVDRLRAAVGALLDASGGRALEATPGTSRL